jgi:hypothetical protein
LIHRQIRRRQRQAVEELQAFAVVHPIRLGRELLDIHALAAGRDIARLRVRVLTGHAFPPLQVQVANLVRRPQRVQLRPSIEILKRVVGAIVRTPAEKRLQIPAIIVVLVEELPARWDVGGKKLALEQRPPRRRHRRVDDYRRRR